MSKLASIRSANAALVERPLVAVFVGGTSGTGEYTIRALARNHGTTGAGLRVYIVGRNSGAAEKMIADCRQLAPIGQFDFLQADVSLLKNVDKCCKQMIDMERKEASGAARIDLLVMSQGILLWGGRKDTSEGLDQSMSLLYYSRIRFIQLLSPLLAASALPARIISIYAAGMESSGKLFPLDLSLTEPGHYSLGNCRAHVVHMTTIIFEHLAKEHEGKMALVHVFPGVVISPSYYAEYHPWWFKVIWWLAQVPVKAFLATPAEEAGQRFLLCASSRYPARKSGRVGTMDIAKATDGTEGGGAYSVSLNGEVYDVEARYRQLRKDGFERRVLEHTMEVLKETVDSEP